MIDRPMRPLFPGRLPQRRARSSRPCSAAIRNRILRRSRSPARPARCRISAAFRMPARSRASGSACSRDSSCSTRRSRRSTSSALEPDRRRHVGRHRHGRGRGTSDLRAGHAAGAAHGARRDPQARGSLQRGLHDAIGKPTRKSWLSVAEGLAGHHRGGARPRRIARRQRRAQPRQGVARSSARSAPVRRTAGALEERFPDGRSDIGKAYESAVKKAVRAAILEEGIRPDGRRTDEIRPIWCEVGVLARTHGSALFTRGQTQALSVVTIGSGQDQQKNRRPRPRELQAVHAPVQLPALLGWGGTAAALTRPSRDRTRRARRACGAQCHARRGGLPLRGPHRQRDSFEQRLDVDGVGVRFLLLALMDAGVPLVAPVAGIAMGLITDEGAQHAAILSDIQGMEDALGDMDFKVAGFGGRASPRCRWTARSAVSAGT